MRGKSVQKESPAKSLVVKRSIVIGGHKTSVSLEDAFWQELKRIAGHQRVTLSSVIGSIDMRRQEGNLSSAIRLFVLEQARARAMAAIAARQSRGGETSTAG
ncbi:MAG: ribbon-helix-helix domain-containing protein [Proteobacteria bacterium]|nr:ribbon-helix-helix domain-containing protein [Pseudomonadota bacterium]